MFQFGEGTVVVLRNDRPGLDLKAGDAGVVWALYQTQPPMYEVTFRDRSGQDFDVTMTEDEITEVVDVPRPELARAS